MAFHREDKSILHSGNKSIIPIIIMHVLVLSLSIVRLVLLVLKAI